MAGTLTVGTISDETNSTSATNVIRGSAKAWANFNGTAASIRASLNASSITRNTTGDYTVNFSSALADSNYNWTTGGRTKDTINTGYVTLNCNSADTPAAYTTSAFRVFQSETGTGARQDSIYCCLSFFR